jgi:hypothetical protein
MDCSSVSAEVFSHLFFEVGALEQQLQSLLQQADDRLQL